MFHRLAAHKYRSLALDYRASQFTPLTAERMVDLANVARACGVTTQGSY